MAKRSCLHGQCYEYLMTWYRLATSQFFANNVHVIMLDSTNFSRVRMTSNAHRASISLSICFFSHNLLQVKITYRREKNIFLKLRRSRYPNKTIKKPLQFMSFYVARNRCQKMISDCASSNVTRCLSLNLQHYPWSNVPRWLAYMLKCSLSPVWWR